MRTVHKRRQWVCVACERHSSLASYYRVKEENLKPRLPIDVMVAAVKARLDANSSIYRQTGWTVSNVPTSERALFGAAGFGNNSALHTAWSAAKRRGYATLDAIDDFCEALDVHPRELYGDAYDESAFGGALPPDFVKTSDVPRSVVAAVRSHLAATQEDPDWWHWGRVRHGQNTNQRSLRGRGRRLG